MNLKFRLLSQNIIILTTALVLTLCFSVIFGYFYGQIEKIPTLNATAQTDVITICGKDKIYASKSYSDVQIKEILMNISMNKLSYKQDSVQYDIAVEEFKHDGGEPYKIIKLTPVVKMGAYYKSMILFMIAVFIAAFIISNIFVLKYNTKNMINPIIKLKQETEKLSAGELDGGIIEEGYGEVRELGAAVEILRVKLKESVYYKEKYDENRTFLISSISHDLKTPVTAIKGYIEGVLDGVANTPEKQKSYLEKAANKTTLITNMIDDLLLYSKLDLNQIPFDIEKTDILEYMKAILDDSLMAFEKEGKRLLLENELSNVYVAVDRNRFQRVIQNILDNAKAHIENDTGEVRIRLRETARSIIIEVKDNGRGISKEDLPHIFDRFYRGDASRKISGSSGLGLAIAKLVVEGLNGRIWAMSEAAQGTSIMISFKKVIG